MKRKHFCFVFLGSSVRSSLQIPHYEDNDVGRNSIDVSSGSISPTNPRLPLRVSRL
jgi:hypothetical protein